MPRRPLLSTHRVLHLAHLQICAAGNLKILCGRVLCHRCADLGRAREIFSKIWLGVSILAVSGLNFVTRQHSALESVEPSIMAVVGFNLLLMTVYGRYSQLVPHVHYAYLITVSVGFGALPRLSVLSLAQEKMITLGSVAVGEGLGIAIEHRFRRQVKSSAGAKPGGSLASLFSVDIEPILQEDYRADRFQRACPYTITWWLVMASIHSLEILILGPNLVCVAGTCLGSVMLAGRIWLRPFVDQKRAVLIYSRLYVFCVGCAWAAINIVMLVHEDTRRDFQAHPQVPFLLALLKVVSGVHEHYSGMFESHIWQVCGVFIVGYACLSRWTALSTTSEILLIAACTCLGELRLERVSQVRLGFV